MAWQIDSTQLGLPGITDIDAGTSTVIGATTVLTYKAKPGQIVRAFDSTYGWGEFIYLLGVANCAVGSVVTYNAATFGTTLTTVGTNVPRPVAISMTANTSNTSYSWFQISGVAVAKKQCTVSLAAGAAVGVLSAGLVAGTGSGKEMSAAMVAAVASAAAGRVTVPIMIQRPSMQGRVS